MKTKFLMTGLLAAVLCMPACNDENEVIVSGITVSPSVIPAMEVGEMMELTATVTPDNATEDIRWEAYDTIVSIENQGKKAILKAVASGTTRIFATNKSGIVVSDEITVKVNSSEYAGFVVGKYSGTAEIRGALNVDVPGVQVKIERVEGENAEVTLTLVADVPAMGELTITGDRVNVSPAGEPETYAFKGVTNPLPLPPPMNIPLNISGKYSPASETLTLSLTADGLSIDVSATSAPTDYAEVVEGEYAGNAEVTGMPIVLSNVEVTLARTGTNKVSLLLTGEAQGMGAVGLTGEDITVSGGSDPETCTFSGKAKLPLPPGFDLNVTGTFNAATRTLTLVLAESNGMFTIDVRATDYGALVAGNYLGSAKLTGAMEADLTGVQSVLERVDKKTAKITVKANVPGFGEVTITGDAIALSAGTEANTCVLSGNAAAAGLGAFDVEGTYDATEKKLGMKLISAAIATTIDVTSVKQE
ncbi:MAG: Ig-like domain-containing protein [Tannerella sp.]|jgi:hypothetical protein|nr:Ig-like domain-containing protein [Tannerella sp.]